MITDRRHLGRDSARAVVFGGVTMLATLGAVAPAYADSASGVTPNLTPSGAVSSAPSDTTITPITNTPAAGPTDAVTDLPTLTGDMAPSTDSGLIPDPTASNPTASNPVATNPVATNPVATNPVATNPVATKPGGAVTGTSNPAGTAGQVSGKPSTTGTTGSGAAGTAGQVGKNPVGGPGSRVGPAYGFLGDLGAILGGLSTLHAPGTSGAPVTYHLPSRSGEPHWSGWERHEHAAHRPAPHGHHWHAQHAHHRHCSC